MTDDYRSTLLQLAEIVRSLDEHQKNTDRTMRSLFLALRTQLPNLGEALTATRTDALLASRTDVSRIEASETLNQIIERLKRQV